MDIHHRLDVFFRGFPTLPGQGVIELLCGRVLPFRRITCAGDGGCLTVQREIHGLTGSAFLSKGRHLVERVESFARPMVHRTRCETRRMR